MTVPSDQFDLPPELTCQPFALVCLAGLDIVNSAVHRSIWEAFNSNRHTDTAPVAFKLLPCDHQFPPAKAKRASYEWYVPKGILKKNWMDKHLNKVPAVVIMFLDLDWNDPSWNEKRVEYCGQVLAFKAALDGRNTRVAVVLIQRDAPLPAGEDMVAAERAATLCSACELSAKSLFVLPHSDHLHGYTLRLENAFYELAQNYYHHAARKVKSHRDYLNKTTHLYLFVRHQFKMGFFNELKQDIHTAHKHYTQAYANLMEVRAVDTNMLEVKTIAGFLNYKICHLAFQLNLPRDAISQFRKHIDIFRNKIGPKELAFEHNAWIAKQFNVFGDIFDDAIKQGLPAIQIQHPGFYYQQAALHSITRKQTITELCEGLDSYPESDPLENVASLEFYGQRPWRPGKVCVEPLDPQREKEGIRALQYKEKTETNHSMLIISMLSNAITQFMKYRCPRMRRHLMVQMAEEYHHSGDYKKALVLLNHVVWDFRCEGWWYLLKSILVLALRCAYLTASLQEYVMFALEIIGDKVQCSAEEKNRVFSNLQKVLKTLQPEPEPNCLKADIQEANEKWKALSLAEPQVIQLEIDTATSFIECKARFTEAQFSADQLVQVEVYIRSVCCQPIRFSRLSVLMTNPVYNHQCVLVDPPASSSNVAETNSLLIQPNETKKFTFHFLPDVMDVHKDIMISSVMLQLGSESRCCVVLRVTGLWSEGGEQEKTTSHFQKCRLFAGSKDFDNVISQSWTSIHPRAPKAVITVSHDHPALVSEWYPVMVSVQNDEDKMLKSALLQMELVQYEDVNTPETTCIYSDGHVPSHPLTSETSAGTEGCGPSSQTVELEELKPKAVTEKIFYLRAKGTEKREVHITLTYSIQVTVHEQTISCCCKNSITVEVSFVQPFDVTARFLSMKFERIFGAHTEEPFLLMPEVICQSPCAVVVHNTELKLAPELQSTDGKLKSQLAEEELQNGTVAAECYSVIADKLVPVPFSAGSYLLYWRRKSHKSDVMSGLNSISITVLPAISVAPSPLLAEMTVPAHGWVRTPLPVTYHLHNRTKRVLELRLTMEASEAFMFSGHKQLHFRILPQNKHTLQCNLYPLLSGYVALPKLHLSVIHNMDPPLQQTQLDEVLERMLPTHMYIMPQAKTNANPQVPVPS